MNTDIIETIRHEIQQSQLPLLERIDELEQQVDMCLDSITSLNVLVGVSMMHIPLASMGSVSELLHNAYNSLPVHQRELKPAKGLLYWAARFEHQQQVWQQDCEQLD